MTLHRQTVPNAGQYLESRVTTASSADLQLMLLDGALRFARKAQSSWDDPAHAGEVHQLLLRVVDVMEAATMGVAESTDPIAQRLEEQYAFLFREFAAVSMGYDRAQFDRAVELLAFERETWRLACEKARGTSAESAGAEPAAPSVVEAPPRRRPLAPPIDAPLPSGGFSMQV
ncbi:MAG: flagellar protein FliS [Pirellulales bacterium]|nr:flagellar protein FliS [Pirellulales bacterium]